MDKSFENILQEKLNGFEAEVPSGAWQKIDHSMGHPFETKLKNKLNNIAAPVGVGLWAAIESKMPNSLESGIQNKLSGFEATPSAALWESISQKVESMPGVFEESMQDKLYSFETAPPPKAASAIFSAIDAKNAFNWKKTISTAAAVLLLFSTMFLIPKKFNEESSLANINSASFFERNNELELKDLASQKSESNSNENENDESANNGFENRLGSSNNVRANSSRNTLGNGIDSQNETKHAKGHNNNNLAFEAGLCLSELPEIKGVNLERKIAQLSPLNIYASFAQNEQIETPQPENKLKFGLLGSSGTFALNTTPNGLLNAYDESSSNFQNELYGIGNFHSLGGNTAFKVGNNASIISGLNLTMAYNEMYFSVDQNNSPSSLNSLVNEDGLVTSPFNPTSNTLSNKRQSALEFKNVDESILDGDSIVTGNQFVVTNQFAFVDLPIGFEFTLKKNPESSITARIGSKIRLVAGAHSYHINHDRDQIVEVNPALSQAFYQTSVVGFSGITYNHSLGDQYELFFGPELNINVTDINKMGTWMSMRPVQVGINVGFRQKMT